MTTTTVLNAVTLTAVGAIDTNITKVSLQTGTSRLAIEASATPSAPENINPTELIVWYAVSSQSLTANAAARLALAKIAKQLKLRLDTTVITVVSQTPAFYVPGAYLYVWVDHPTKNGTVALSVFSNET